MNRPQGPAPADVAEDDDLPEVDAGETPAAERRSFQVPQTEHGQRLDRVLAALVPEFSRSHLQSLVERGHVRLDGSPAAPAARRLRAGQRLEVELEPPAQVRAFRPEPLPLVVLFEDNDLLVIDKPAGLVVHPAPGHWSGTLLNGLLAHHPGAAALPRAGIVHRLDKDTSGVMMVAKSLQAMTALVRDIAARRVQRHYLALAHGVVADELVIDAPIGRDPRSRIRMAIVASGRPARTDVWCVAARGDISAVRCRLHTGRTHQIRVHLASRGHPLVGDALYGGRPALGLARQGLHAHRLALSHPVGGRSLSFECPAPPDFRQAWFEVAGEDPPLAAQAR